MYAHDYLLKARHDDLMRAAARDRLAAQARRPRPPRRHLVITAPGPAPGRHTRMEHPTGFVVTSGKPVS
jgi:hypothetical protein